MNTSTSAEFKEAQRWLQNNPDTNRVDVVLCDLNSVFRGKSVPVGALEKLYAGKMRMPVSSFYFDVWGNDVTRISYATGDLDGVCTPSNIGMAAKHWSSHSSALLIVTLTNDEGVSTFYDPRNQLIEIVKQYKEYGLNPAVALEMEFYLTDLKKTSPRPPVGMGENGSLQFQNSYSVDELEMFSDFTEEVINSAEKMNIPTDSVLSECGCGQFEINLQHRNDAVRAADDAILLRQIIKGVARKHGYRATFMAKPYLAQGGSSMHMHFSVYDDSGINIFDDGTEKGSIKLHHAVGGLSKLMNEITLFCAPHLNSYRRIKAAESCPKKNTWGYDNRTVALRIPSGDNKNRRIEFRLPGADANPYLVVASALGSALYGIKKKIEPPKPSSGNAYLSNGASIPSDWASAIDAMRKGTRLKEVFDNRLVKVFLTCKEQEFDVFSEKISQFEYSSYLDIP